MAPDTVIAQMKKISSSYQETVLTGIHTGRYGREYGISLAQLMERILRETSIGRLRISSIEITELDDDLISLMEQYPDRIARHLHIPLQSGCDEILKAMHRPYTTQQYYDRIEEIRNRLGQVSISCDLMTGFPNESEEYHQQAMAFVRKCGFAFLHVFPFSEREGTPAASMPNPVAVNVRKQRAKQAIALSQQLSEIYQKGRIGQKDIIVAETYKDGYTTGYTSDYIQVHVKGKLPQGKMIPVILESYEDGKMYAKEREVYETE